MKPRIYDLFRSVDRSTPERGTIAVMVLIAALITGFGIQRVRARHEVVFVGYQLSKATEDVRHLREVRRQLELERATLTNPDRIRTLAAALGMAPVPPDQIRIVTTGHPVARRSLPSASRPTVPMAPPRPTAPSLPSPRAIPPRATAPQRPPAAAPGGPGR